MKTATALTAIAVVLAVQLLSVEAKLCEVVKSKSSKTVFEDACDGDEDCTKHIFLWNDQDEAVFEVSYCSDDIADKCDQLVQTCEDDAHCSALGFPGTICKDGFYFEYADGSTSSDTDLSFCVPRSGIPPKDMPKFEACVRS